MPYWGTLWSPRPSHRFQKHGIQTGHGIHIGVPIPTLLAHAVLHLSKGKHEYPACATFSLKRSAIALNGRTHSPPCDTQTASFCLVRFETDIVRRLLGQMVAGYWHCGSMSPPTTVPCTSLKCDASAQTLDEAWPHVLEMASVIKRDQNNGA